MTKEELIKYLEQEKDNTIRDLRSPINMNNNKFLNGKIEAFSFCLYRLKKLNEAIVSEVDKCQHHFSSSRVIINGIEHKQCFKCKGWHL